jgi:hypothetical protein
MPLTDDEVIAQHNDLEMLRRPHLWPNKSRLGNPVVFLKRRMENGRRGETGPCTFVKARHSVDEYVVRAHNWDEQGTVRTIYYGNADAVIADGWIVD